MMRKKKQPSNPTPVTLEKGEMIQIGNANQFEWKINKFLSLWEEVYKSYTSPSFSFNSEYWYLKITDANDVYNISLCRESDDPPITVKFSVAVKTIYGVNDLERQYIADFKKEITPRQPLRLVTRRELLKKKTVFVPSGILTVVCSLQIPESAENASEIISRECFCCKEILKDEFIFLHKKCIFRSKCTNLYGVDQQQNRLYDHQCQAKPAKGDESICEDFKKMLANGQNHDLVLKIGEKEFRAHKDVLMAQSRVFESMLNHDMAEKNTGFINAPDCDPQAMEAFLLYLYCGQIETQDQSTILGLYYIADKYEIIKLKSDCGNFIKLFLSPSNFCEVIELALNHSDPGLLEFATEYFVNNMPTILRTVEWQFFLKDNSTAANELLIKACEMKK